METPDTTEAVADALQEFVDPAWPSKKSRMAAIAAIQAHNKAMAKAVPFVEAPENFPIPYNYHGNQDAVYAYVDGFNEARRLFLGEQA